MRSFLALLMGVVVMCAQSQVCSVPGSDQYAATRVAPGSIPTLPIMPTWVNAPLQVGLSTDLYSAFMDKYGSQLTHGDVTVDPAIGNDSNCAVQSTKPCATLSKATRILRSSNVYIKCPASGIYLAANATDFDYRYSDPGYTGPKRWIFDRPCMLRFPGDNISTNAWSVTSGHTGMYQTAIACFGTKCGAVSAVQMADGTTDNSGFTDEWSASFPARIPSAAPNQWASSISYKTGQYVWFYSYVLYQAAKPNYNSSPSSGTSNANWNLIGPGTMNFTNACLSNLDQIPSGWCFAPDNHTLYVKLNGQDLTEASNAAKITARYYPSGSYFSWGSVARVNVYGTTLFIQNAYLDGVHFEMSQFNSNGKWMNPELWAQNCTVFNAKGYGFQIRGGWTYTQNCVAHANQYDGWNADLGSDGVTTGNFANYYARGTLAGDPSTYDTGILPGTYNNLNGASSHNGYHVEVGSFFSGNNGPECGDGGNATVATSQSWFVATVCGVGISTSNVSNPGGFQMQGLSAGDSRSRQVWIDTGLSINESLSGVPYAISITNGAQCKVYNAIYDAPVFYTHASQCTPFTPNAP